MQKLFMNKVLQKLQKYLNRSRSNIEGKSGLLYSEPLVSHKRWCTTDVAEVQSRGGDASVQLTCVY